MTVKTHTEPGGKEVNEDFVFARRLPSGGDRYVCILADGQGGRANGALAARAACEAVWARALEHPFDALLQPSMWTILLYAADQAVCRTGGYTALVALAVDGSFVVGASCGDAKVFFSQKNGTAPLLRAARALEVTEWTARQQKNPPVGSGDAVFVPFSSNELGGGRILMLSDGVWKYCGFDAIRSAFGMPVFQESSTVLRAATVKRAGVNLPDDFSVIAVECSE